MRQKIRDLKFTNKLLLIFLGIIVIPSIFLSIIEFTYSSRIMEEKTNDYLKSMSSVTLSKIESTISDIEDMAFYINGNDNIQNALMEEENALSDRKSYYAVYEEICSNLKLYALFRQEVSAISILSENNRTYSYTKNRSSIDIAKYIKSQNQYWVVDGEHVMLMKQIYAFPMKECLGYTAIDVDDGSLYQLIEDIEYAKEGNVFLVNEEGKVIAAEEQELQGDLLPDAYRNCFGEQEAFYGDVLIDNQHYSIYNSAPISNGWHMLLAIPRDYYMRDIVGLRNIVTLITFLVALVASAASLLIARQITQPIQKLSNAMEQFGQGNFEINNEVKSDDEIGRLSKTFNTMVADMNSLVKSVYEEKMMKQDAQMKSLQMQINPHFLYNTLDTINWMARIKHVDEVGDMAAALGNLMRYSLSEKSYVTIKEEVDNLKNYLAIQNVRYGDQMESKIAIEEEFYDLYIPKLLIQPMVENAIIHGLEQKMDKGHVLISAYVDGENLYIVVEDDGVGMTEDAVEQIMCMDHSQKTEKHTSIGIVNVNRRIQMIYGKEYGLLIQSVLGAGTKMTLHMKVITEYLE